MKHIMKIMIPNKIVLFKFVIFIFITLAAVSCRTKKESSPVAMADRNKAELLNALSSNTIHYNTLNCKLKVNFNPDKKGKSFSSNANLKIIKNEKLQLSFQPSLLGISMEAVRMSFSADSIIILDRINKMYVSESLNNIKNIVSFDFDLQNLEALFTNQLFIMGKSDITPDDYKSFAFEQSKYEAFLRTKDKMNLSYTFATDHTDKIRYTQINSSNVNLLWKYDNFMPVSNQLFPMNMKLDLNSLHNELITDFSFSKIEIDKNFKINSQIPDNYKQVSLEQAIQILKRLL